MPDSAKNWKSCDNRTGDYFMKYCAVLFDLDGTLLNTIDDIGNSMNTVLERCGFPEHRIDDYKYFVGEGIDTLVRRALPENHRDDATVTRCVSAMIEEYEMKATKNTRPYPGIPELLDALQSRGVRISILSNKPDGPTKSVVSSLFSAWKFDAVVGARPHVPLKPDPTAALEIAADMGISPKQFIYCGDTEIDMCMAQVARMYPVGALWGYRTADELRSAGALALIDKPADLLDWV
jgi:phosphoglycolate phosphatase